MQNFFALASLREKFHSLAALGRQLICFFQVFMVRGVEKRHSEISTMIFANCCAGMYDNCQTLRLRQHNHYFIFFSFATHC